MARRSDGLYSRRGYWYFKFKVPGGMWRERATRTPNYADARKIRTDFLADLEQGKLPNERARWTLQQAIEQHLADRKYRLAPGSYVLRLDVTQRSPNHSQSHYRTQNSAVSEHRSGHQELRGEPKGICFWNWRFPGIGPYGTLSAS